METDKETQLRELQARLDDCIAVIDGLQGSRAWEIVSNDVKKQMEQIDTNWQNVYDADRLNALRALKNAVSHVLSLLKQYADEIEQITAKMFELKGETIEKDYDYE